MQQRDQTLRRRSPQRGGHNKRFQLQKIEWENFGVLDGWSLMRGDDYTRRLDCIQAYNYYRDKKH